MYKFLLSLIFVVAFSAACYGQNWHQHGGQWHNHYHNSYHYHNSSVGYQAIIRKVLAWVLVGFMFRRVENMLGLVLTVDIGFNKEAQFITTLGLEVIEDIIDKVLKFFKIFAHNSFL